MVIRTKIRWTWPDPLRVGFRLGRQLKHSRFNLQIPANSNPNSKQFSTSNHQLSSFDTDEISILRNISISAHVDSGKTTLTERLLSLTNSITPPTSSNSTSSSASSNFSPSLPGDVDSGSTVTDFLEAERRRGITIQSAAVGPIWWPPFPSNHHHHHSATSKGKERGKDQDRIAITLVDTPGHIDFSIEVERALRVVDGNIVLLDAVEGVEAQTETVWKTAKRYGIKSTLLFINKLDRQGASISKSLNSIISKNLHPLPILLQLPISVDQFHLNESSSSSSSLNRNSGLDATSVDRTSNMSAEERAFSLDSGIMGLIDIVTLEKLHFNDSQAGEIISRKSLLSNSALTSCAGEGILLKEAIKARNHLIETLSNHDDELLELLLEKESVENYVEIGPLTLKKVIRRLALQGKILPVFLGSAVKNVGIQPLLDGIRDYLPSPLERDQGFVKGKIQRLGQREDKVEVGKRKKSKNKNSNSNQENPNLTLKDNSTESISDTPLQSPSQGSLSGTKEVSIHLKNSSLVALAFKVVYDKRRGPLTFIRIYSGTLRKSDTLFNTSLGKKENFTKILLPYADQYVEVEELSTGKIGVLTGLKDTMTGDTLVDKNLHNFGKKDVENVKLGSDRHDDDDGKSSESGDILEYNPQTLKLREINIPPPVFSISIEPFSKSDELPVLEALKMLIRTDPSLRLDDGTNSSNSGGNNFGNAGTTGQMILSGMGELHLEISKDRLKDEFGVKARIGKVRVSFRESVGDEIELDSIEKFDNYKELLDQIQKDGDIIKLSAIELLDREIAGKKLKAGIEVELRPLVGNEEEICDESDKKGKSDGVDLLKIGGNLVEIDLNELEIDAESSSNSSGKDEEETSSSPSSSSSNHSISSIRSALISGLTASLSRGTLTSSPITNLYIKLSKPKLFGPELSSTKALSMVSNLSLRNLFKASDPRVMEPVMKINVKINKVHLGKVVADLTGYQDGVVDEVLDDDEGVEVKDEADPSRHGMVYFPPEIQSSTSSKTSVSQGEEGKTVIRATVPLSNLVGYSTRLRALTAGTGIFEMEFKGFKRVSKDRQLEILKGLGRA